MLKNNIKKIILSLVAILLVVSAGCTVFATESDDDMNKLLNELLQEENGEQIGEDEEPEQIPEGTVDNKNTNTDLNTNTNVNTNTNTNENRPETTPHAGLEDYTGLIFVAIFAVSAVYAYKKVNEYNG